MGGKLQIEYADTHAKREKGLMFRRHLGESEGMLFKFPSSQRLTFWMKNTYIPLDIAFLDDNGFIKQIETMSPLSTKTTSSKSSCKYALEVNKGWFSRNKIDVGGHIDGLMFNKKYAQNMGGIGLPNVSPQTPQPNQQPGQQPNQQPNQQVNPEVLIDFGIRDKLDYAEKRKLKLKLMYMTQKDPEIGKEEHEVGPRIVSPIDGKYPITYENGHHIFRAYDESPTINGNNYVVEGGKIKSFILDNVERIELLDENGNLLGSIKGFPQNVQENVNNDKGL